MWHQGSVPGQRYVGDSMEEELGGVSWDLGDESIGTIMRAVVARLHEGRRSMGKMDTMATNHLPKQAVLKKRWNTTRLVRERAAGITWELRRSICTLCVLPGSRIPQVGEVQ